MRLTLKEIAIAAQARIQGAVDTPITGVASLSSAKAGDLIFVQEERQLAEAEKSAAAAIIAGSFAEKRQSSKPLLVSDQPRLAFCRAAALFQSEVRDAAIHPTAIVHSTTKLSAGVSVAERAIIAENVTIGDRTQIGAGCVVASGVVIGSDCRLYPNVTLYSGTRLGNRVIVHAGAVLGSDGFGYVRDRNTGRYEKFPQIGSLEIADE